MQHNCLYKMDFGPIGATPPVPAPWGYIKIPNVFPPVLINRAITCDSFMVLAQKDEGKSCDNKKKRTQNPTFWPLETRDGHWTIRPMTKSAHNLFGP